MKLYFLLLTLTTFALPAQAAEKLHVVASFSILGDMTREVAGDAIDLKTLVGPNGDTHEYEPTPTDAKTLAHADLTLINGLGLEGWMDRLISASGTKAKMVIATAGIATLPNDPHAWQNVTNGKIYVANIRDALAAADPAHASQYKANAGAYIQKLDALDNWVKAQIATVPENKRKVISTHDAFRYFAKAYGVDFIAPLGISTDAQASAGDLAKLIRQIREEKITALFFENMTDSRLIKQLETDAHAHIGGTLYSDALSPPGGPAPNYIAMFRHNVPELVETMQTN